MISRMLRIMIVLTISCSSIAACSKGVSGDTSSEAGLNQEIKEFAEEHAVVHSDENDTNFQRKLYNVDESDPDEFIAELERVEPYPISIKGSSRQRTNIRNESMTRKYHELIHQAYMV